MLWACYCCVFYTAEFFVFFNSWVKKETSKISATRRSTHTVLSGHSRLFIWVYLPQVATLFTIYALWLHIDAVILQIFCGNFQSAARVIDEHEDETNHKTLQEDVNVTINGFFLIHPNKSWINCFMVTKTQRTNDIGPKVGNVDTPSDWVCLLFLSVLYDQINIFRQFTH